MVRESGTKRNKKIYRSSSKPWVGVRTRDIYWSPRIKPISISKNRRRITTPRDRRSSIRNRCIGPTKDDLIRYGGAHFGRCIYCICLRFINQNWVLFLKQLTAYITWVGDSFSQVLIPGL